MFQWCTRFIGLRNSIFFIAGLGVLLVCNSVLLLWQSHSPLQPAYHDKQVNHGPDTPYMHPIDDLMADAERKFEALISEQTPTDHTKDTYRTGIWLEMLADKGICMNLTERLSNQFR
jgi:hypothetical protein